MKKEQRTLEPDHRCHRSDEELTWRARQGCMAACDCLYRRHNEAAQRFARTLVRDYSTADDLVSSAFEGTIKALRNGAGPNASFRAYIYTCIRNLAAAESDYRGRHISTSHETLFDIPVNPHQAEVREEWAFMKTAFSQLPERWRTALWYTAVEGLTPAEAGEYMALSANAVSALTFRARAGLRLAYEAEDRRITVKTASVAPTQKPVMTLSRAPQMGKATSMTLSKETNKMTLSMNRQAGKARAPLGRPQFAR